MVLAGQTTAQTTCGDGRSHLRLAEPLGVSLKARRLGAGLTLACSSNPTAHHVSSQPSDLSFNKTQDTHTHGY